MCVFVIMEGCQFLTCQGMASLSLTAPRDPRPSLLQEPPPCRTLGQLCSPAAWLPGASPCFSPTCWEPGQSAMCWFLAQVPKGHCQPTQGAPTQGAPTAPYPPPASACSWGLGASLTAVLYPQALLLPSLDCVYHKNGKVPSWVSPTLVPPSSSAACFNVLESLSGPLTSLPSYTHQALSEVLTLYEALWEIQQFIHCEPSLCITSTRS